MTARWLRILARQPWWIAHHAPAADHLAAAVRRAVRARHRPAGLRRRTTTSRTSRPGIIVMTALFSGGWNGMGMLEDLRRGTLDRFLVSPVRRLPLDRSGRSARRRSSTHRPVADHRRPRRSRSARRTAAGVLGVAVLLVVRAAARARDGGAVATRSRSLTRQEETLIGAVQFIVLPATFVATAFMPRSSSRLDRATSSQVQPGRLGGDRRPRGAVSADVDWGVVGGRIGLLAALAAVATFGGDAGVRRLPRGRSDARTDVQCCGRGLKFRGGGRSPEGLTLLRAGDRCTCAPVDSQGPPGRKCLTGRTARLAYLRRVRRTKIVATIGPASRDREVLRRDGPGRAWTSRG